MPDPIQLKLVAAPTSAILSSLPAEIAAFVITDDE